MSYPYKTNMKKGTGLKSVLENKLGKGEQIYFRCKIKRDWAGGYEYWKYVHVKSKNYIMTFNAFISENKPDVFRKDALYPLTWSTVSAGLNIYYPLKFEWLDKEQYDRAIIINFTPNISNALL
jgi:hypothetical protein